MPIRTGLNVRLRRDKFRAVMERIGAKLYNHHTPEDQAIIRAAHDGREPGYTHYFSLVPWDDIPEDAGVKRWTVWHVVYHGKRGRAHTFSSTEVEDFGHRYRVRQDGRNDRWHSVKKERAENAT